MSSSKPSGEIGIKSILIAYDFSEASRKALRHSLAIARHYGAKLHLAYVVSSIGYPSIHSLRRRSVAAVYGLPSVAPHDLRRTCARLCHQAGGELDQIQFLLGHVSIQTTERYLGCKQRFHDAVNDHIGLEPDAPS